MLSDSKRCSEILSGLLPERKPKGSVPVLVGFDSPSSGRRRYVFTDLPREAVLEMRARFREIEPEGTDEEFMTLMWMIVRDGTPRVYRCVDFIDLRRNHL